MPKDRLWAPWRIQYIEADKGEAREGGSGCIFCDKPAEEEDEKNLIVHRGEHAYVILNGYPYNNGHVMVVPYKHVAEFHALDKVTRDEVGELTRCRLEVLERGVRPGRIQRRHQPGRGRRRRHRRPPAPAHRSALGRRHELHAGGRRHAGAARGLAHSYEKIRDAFAAHRGA